MKTMPCVGMAHVNNRHTRNAYVNIPAAHLKWWKSCASGEGMKGRWYPEWLCVVLNKDIATNSHTTERWEPKMTLPRWRGMRSARMRSSGCE